VQSPSSSLGSSQHLSDSGAVALKRVDSETRAQWVEGRGAALKRRRLSGVVLK